MVGRFLVRYLENDVYTCGIIAESLADTGILRELERYFQSERVQEVRGQPEPVWHIRQYGLPQDTLVVLLPRLAAAIRPGWYIHLFNVADGVLYVVLKDRFFKLPTKRDQSWEEMIAHGESVGLDRRWTENVPLRV